MRTPNASCILCEKPLYRRPMDLARARYSACVGCRAKAQSVAGVTDAQAEGLSRGRVKGTNRRQGYRHREETKAQTAAANRAFWSAHPELAIARGAKTRGEAHYRWNGGSSRLNTSIRQMHENRRWMDAVKARDGCCCRCGGTERLESHHRITLAEIIDTLGIKSRDDARRNADTLWDLNNGETLCRPCHDTEHGRARNEAA